MTVLTSVDHACGPKARSVWLIALLVGASLLAGCIGDAEDDGAPEDGLAVYLAASGEASPATAELLSVGLAREDTSATQFIKVDTETFDLAQLSADGQALLAATTTDTGGEVSRTVLRFTSLTVGNRTLGESQLEVPLAYPVEAGIEATVTLDLDEIQATGELALAHLVVERGQERLASITGSELTGPDRQEVSPLATPTIVATPAEGNDSFPSFQVNTDINFTIDIEETQDARVREVFWRFSDNTTTSGREITHAFRSPGPHSVTAIVEGTRGQQATAQVSLEAYFATSGEGNIFVGTGGLGGVQDRDVKNHPVDLQGPLTSVTVRVKASPSGDLCADDGTCAPANLHIELLDPEGEVVASNTTDANPKFVNLTAEDQPLTGGEWTLRVKGDTGGAVGYSWSLEAHYLGLLTQDHEGHTHDHGN